MSNRVRRLRNRGYVVLDIAGACELQVFHLSSVPEIEDFPLFMSVLFHDFRMCYIMLSHELRACGEELTRERKRELCGKEIALVPQSVAYLDPLIEVGKQVDGHYKPRLTEKRKKLFERFHLPSDTARLYPYQLSGGMARRVLVSSALVTDAALSLRMNRHRE